MNKSAAIAEREVLVETGPPSHGRRRVAGELTRRGVWALTLAVLAVLVAYPVARICWLAISDPATDTFAPSTFIDQLTSSTTWAAARNTVVMAGGATVLAVLAAVPMAWLCVRTNLLLRRQVTGLVFLTFMCPPILLGLAYILLFGPTVGLATGALHALGVQSTIYSWWGLIFTTTCGSYPIVFMTTAAALESLDGDLDNAAIVHGASTVRTAIRVTLPLVRPAIASGCLLSFVLALNAFGVQALIAIPARIPLLTTTIYSYFSYPIQLTPAADQAVLLIAISLIVTLVVNGYVARRTFPTIAGKGVRPEIIRLSARGQAAGLALCAMVTGLSIVVPMVIIVMSSFARVPGIGFSPSNLSLDGYRNLIALNDAKIALRNSFVLGILSALGMVVLAISLSYFRRQNTRGARAAKILAEIPFVIPGIVLAVGLIAAYSRPPVILYGTFAILVFAYVAKFLPIAMRFTDNALGQVAAELEESVYAHGGSRWMALRMVLIPLIRNGIVVAGVISFVFAFNELSASILLIGNGSQVASTVLLHYNEEGLLSQMNAFATIIFAVTACCYAVIMRVAGRSLFGSSQAA